MDSLVVKGKMQILATGYNKGFTILEILIVLAIISISGTSFYLILNQPKTLNNFLDLIEEYSVLSTYSGNTYGLTHNSINLWNSNSWEKIQAEDLSQIYSVTNNDGQEIIIEEDMVFLIISPGFEKSIKSLTLTNGEIIDI